MTDHQPETPEIVDDQQVSEDGQADATVSEPAKVMRIGTMIKQLLEEVRATDLDEPGRDRLREIYETSVEELSEALSSDLRDELQRLALPFDDEDVPSGARAAGGPGAARRLARRSLPRHPGHLVRPADRSPAAARDDAAVAGPATGSKAPRSRSTIGRRGLSLNLVVGAGPPSCVELHATPDPVRIVVLGFCESRGILKRGDRRANEGLRWTRGCRVHGNGGSRGRERRLGGRHAQQGGRGLGVGQPGLRAGQAAGLHADDAGADRRDAGAGDRRPRRWPGRSSGRRSSRA